MASKRGNLSSFCLPFFTSLSLHHNELDLFIYRIVLAWIERQGFAVFEQTAPCFSKNKTVFLQDFAMKNICEMSLLNLDNLFSNS